MDQMDSDDAAICRVERPSSRLNDLSSSNPGIQMSHLATTMHNKSESFGSTKTALSEISRACWLCASIPYQVAGAGRPPAFKRVGFQSLVMKPSMICAFYTICTFGFRRISTSPVSHRHRVTNAPTSIPAASEKIREIPPQSVVAPSSQEEGERLPGLGELGLRRPGRRGDRGDQGDQRDRGQTDDPNTPSRSLLDIRSEVHCTQAQSP
jgi:hypothetical protein